jgi:hypothetical protein
MLLDKSLGIAHVDGRRILNGIFGPCARDDGAAHLG